MRNLLSLKTPSPLQNQACLPSVQTQTAWPPNFGAGWCCGSASQPRLGLGKDAMVMIKSSGGDQRMELIISFPAKQGPPRLSPTRLLLSRRPFPTRSPSAWVLAARDHPNSGATSAVSSLVQESPDTTVFLFLARVPFLRGHLTTGMRTSLRDPSPRISTLEWVALGGGTFGNDYVMSGEPL